MTVRANFTRSWLRRYLLMAVLALGWASWCAYDGLVAYPARYERAEEYARLEGLEKPQRDEAWKKIAREKGWPVVKPDSAEEVRGSILQQYVMGVLGLVIGLPAIGCWIVSRNAWVERTDTGLKTSWGQSVDFSTVESLNKRKWKHKGIARALYRDGDRTRTFVFDDFKFERQPLGKILRDLEAVLDDSKILEGTREPEPERSSTTKSEPTASA